MRNLTLIVAGIAAVAIATPAEAQRVWRDGQWVARGSDRAVQRTGASYPAPRAGTAYPARSVPRTRINPPRGGNPGGRWGGKAGGRWEGGTRAPGGWGAYRRPVRGWTLPRYWIGGSFFVSDWSSWGLSSPPYGYQWVRYYDDAVLVDRGGKVWDSVSGVDWNRGAGGYAEADAYAGGGYASAAAAGGGGGGGYGAGYPPPAYDDEPYPSRPIPSEPYPGGYAPPPAYAAPAAQSPCGAPSPCSYRGGGYQGGYASGGYTQGSGYAAGGYGYYYGEPVTTTIVIQSAPVVTTTVTEEVVEEVATYAAPRTVRRVSTKGRAPTKRLYRTPTKSCDC